VYEAPSSGGSGSYGGSSDGGGGYESPVTTPVMSP
jgi:hypothetical protein